MRDDDVEGEKRSVLMLCGMRGRTKGVVQDAVAVKDAVAVVFCSIQVLLFVFCLAGCWR